MSPDGWIPREQPRGPELRSFIPGLKEDKQETNPPTLLWNFLYLHKIAQVNSTVYKGIGHLWPQLKVWFDSWYKSQGVYVNGTHANLFKWWSLIEDSSLGSGMDDWPRYESGYVSKYNIDAACWGYMFANSMAQLAATYDNANVTAHFKSLAATIKKNIYDTMLDPHDLLFKDLLVHVNDSKIVKHSSHLGYPNLLPIIVGLIDEANTTILDAQIRFMSDKKGIWSEYGLRSLSMQDTLFGKGSNYWRGPIWINIHYMVL
jgi:mannosyl-oligosaccharide glucosidase